MTILALETGTYRSCHRDVKTLRFRIRDGADVHRCIVLYLPGFYNKLTAALAHLIGRKQESRY